MWRIVATTNPYQGSRHSGFKYTDDREHMYRIEEDGLSFTEVNRALLRLLNRKCGTSFKRWKEADEDFNLELLNVDVNISLYGKRYACFELDGILYNMEKY